MDRPRRPEPAAPPARGPAGRNPSDEQALWDAFAVASTPETFYRTWLAIQCQMVPGVGSAVIVAGQAGSGPFTPTAFWPERPRGVTHLAEAAERAMTERRGQIIHRQVPAENGAPAGERYDVAYPIQGQGKIYGVVALDLTPRPEAELRAVLRQLQWGSAWLELMVDRRETGDAGVAEERLQAVLELMGTVLVAPSARGAMTAFATALATRLHCERVSVGFISRGRARVRAVSHAAHFGRQSNLVRAIGMAMDEAIDQQGTVRVSGADGRGGPDRAGPRGADGAARLRRRLYHPADRRRAGGGALTLERPADRPFDGEVVELCEALAAAGRAGAGDAPARRPVARDQGWQTRSATGWAGCSGRDTSGLKAATAALLAAIAVLVFAQGDYRVSARTVMEASTRGPPSRRSTATSARRRCGPATWSRRARCWRSLDDRELRLERARSG